MGNLICLVTLTLVHLSIQTVCEILGNVALIITLPITNAFTLLVICVLEVLLPNWTGILLMIISNYLHVIDSHVVIKQSNIIFFIEVFFSSFSDFWLKLCV